MKLLDIIRQVTGYSNFEWYDNESYIAMWNDWYRGKVDKFHSYSVYNGKKSIKCDRMTLGMSKRVCEDWANLLINEKTDVTFNSETAQKAFENLLKECKFWRKANEGIEKSFALGVGALVASVENAMFTENGDLLVADQLGANRAKVNCTFVNGTKVKPITFENGEITECAFINVDSKKTYISVHLKDENGIYKIHNIIAKGEGDSLTFGEEDYYVFDTKSELPWFAILKPNLANNIDINSPLGISIFANQIDILKEIDLIYDSYATEFILGRKRIFVNTDQITVDPVTGEQIEVFDSNDLVFYVLPPDNNDTQLIQDSTQTLRVTDHQLAIQNQLNLLSYGCGFGTNHYKFDGSSIATATQIVSENSELFRTLKKHEIVIEEALTTIFNAMIYAANTFTATKIDSSEFEIKFDDSIIEDKQGEMANDRLDVSMGVMSKAEFRAKWYNEDLATAQRKIDEMSTTTITDYDPYADDEEGGDENADGQ